MGEELLHSPTPIGERPQKGSLYRRLLWGSCRRWSWWTSQNSLNTNFAARTLCEVRRILIPRTPVN